jgi:predicted ATP-binding protein involved in virulence
MRVTNLFIRNFRGIEDLALYFSAQTTVLVGINGSCKSTILECLAMLLSYSTLSFHNNPRWGIGAADIRSGHTEATMEMTVNFNGNDYRTVMNIRTEDWDFDCSNLDSEIEKDLEFNPGAGLPIAVFYPVSRYVSEIPAGPVEKHAFPQIRAYEGAFANERVDFKTFFEWFRIRQDLENEQRAENLDYQDPQLHAVRRAIEAMLPGFGGLRFRRAPARMVIYKDYKGERETELLVSQMSDGEKSVLSTVGDIARRLAIANSGTGDPLLGRGTVLLDEIALHLHPAWQRRAVRDLEGVFPNCQFIVTTHSPQVLTHVKPKSIYLLKPAPEGVTAYRPTSSLGTITNSILEELMGVPDRSKEIRQDMERYFRLVDTGQTQEAAIWRKRLEETFAEEDEEFAAAEVPIRRKESSDS